MESKWFRALLPALNKDYVCFSRKVLAGSLLKQILHETQDEKKKDLENKDVVMVVDGWKNRAANNKKILISIKFNTKQYVLESYDVSEALELDTRTIPNCRLIPRAWH